MANCPAFDPTGPYVSQVVRFVDCHSLSLGVDGYHALGPASGFGMALSGLLTIYVALIGYRLLLGGQITVREGVFAAIRLGFVLSLATQWAAYQPLVYDVVTAGPGDLAGRVLAPGGIGGDASGRLIDRVQGTHETLGELIRQLAPVDTTASPTGSPAAAVAGGAPAAAAPAAATPSTQPTTAAATNMAEARAALISADRLLVGTTLAGTLAVRVIAALLLALGPIFIACLLFEATRGLFAGWVRVLAGTALASIAAALVIALELAVIEPQAQALRDLLDNNQPAGQLPQDMLATCACFAVIMLAALIALTRTTAAFRLPVAVLHNAGQVFAPREPASRDSRMPANQAPQLQQRGERSRAEQVADAARAIERRDGQAGGNAPSTVPGIAARAPAARLQTVVLAPLPLGQAGRRTAPRTSSAAGRRDTGRPGAGRMETI